MPKSHTPRTPMYCRHKSTGRAYARLDGRMIYLGAYGTPESRAEYDRIIAEWLAHGRQLPQSEIPTDVTVEAVRDMLDKELPGFNDLFMQLSYAQVKSAAMLSRALAGVIKGKAIFCLPGSPRACEMAMESLILPELGHVLMLLRS